MSVAKSTGTVLFVAITAKPAGQLFTLDGFLLWSPPRSPA